MKSLSSTHFYFLSVLGFFCLFMLLMLFNAFFSPLPHLPIALILIVSVTPILIPFRGFLNGNKKSCAWMALISLFYLLHGISGIFSNPDDRLFSILETVFSLLLFVGITFYLRLLGKPTE
ncbi:MAG: DUF2069 domain-containing protein [Thiotrichaceae bacterium]|nr:DUF2069 domain-containing protein [Thiotrichaceae bacterium]